MDDSFTVSGTDSEDLSLRHSSVTALTSFCYQEFVDTYGEATVSYISQEEGYELRFKSLNVCAFYKNTSENPNIIDRSTRIPADNTRPYKLLVLSPSLIFVNFDGYISNERLCALFKTQGEISYIEAKGTWVTSFHWGEGRIAIETDSKGNLYKTDASIEIFPDEIIKADWVEESEAQTESETQPQEYFVLGSQTFTYDVTSIHISGEAIGSLEALSQCKNLEELILTDCMIDGLEPLAGCSALKWLDLRGTTGFSDLSPLAGLGNLRMLDLHGCALVSDISPIMEMELWLLHTCETAVTYEQTMEYKQRHPDCEVWYDNHILDAPV